MMQPKSNLASNIEISTKSRRNKIEYDETKIPQEEKLNDRILLNTINEISKRCNLHFENFNDANKFGNNLAKFVLYLLEKDQSANNILNQIIQADYSNIEKIKKVIDFLKSIEPKFNILIFDFNNPDYIESSSILLYTNILDFFFLKKSKDELYDRCYTFIYGKYKKGDFSYEPYHKKHEILCDMNTYTTLINFINNKECKFEFDQFFNDNPSSKVPLVVTQSYLDSFPSTIIPPACYYQLQIIFDALDSGDFPHRLLEYFLITIRKFASIKVPPTDQIFMSIRTKYLSLIQQNKRRKKNYNFQINKEEIQINNEDSDDDDLSANKSEKKPIEHKKELYEIHLNTDELNINNKKIYYDNGILCERKLDETQLLDWIEFMSYAQIDTKKEQKLSSDFKPYFIKIVESEPLLGLLRVYKLYTFDEKIEKWIISDYSFMWPYDSPLFIHSQITNPLILFIETSTTDTLTFLKTINGVPNDDIVLDENDICVYAIRNRKLSDLKFDDTKLHIKRSDTFPFFLFLYVPESKKELPNIHNIVFQMYAFLSIICDIKIVILDISKYKEQIEFILKIDKLRHSYEIKDEVEISISKSYTKKSEEEEECDIDLDDEEDYQDNEVNGNDMKKKLLQKIHPDLLKCRMNLFVLINDDEVQNQKTNIKIKSTKLFDEIKRNMIYCGIYFVNLNNPKTYGDFMNILIKYIDLVEYKIDIYEKIKLIDYFHMDSNYINLLYDHENWKENLLKIIHKKFSKMINQDNELSSKLEHLLTLQKDIFTTFPLLDNEYFSECNLILKDLKEQITKDQIYQFTKELQEISTDNLNHIKLLIKSKLYLSNNQLNNIKNSHFNFLKDKYFQIIQKSYPTKLLSVVYADNKIVLDNQIAKDDEIITKIIEKFKKKLEQRQPNEVNAQKGTNYTIREKENEREIKVRIDNGRNLKDLIDQDF